MVGWILFLWPRKTSQRRRTRECLMCLGLPVFVVSQKIVFVPVVHCSLQKQPADAQVTHFLEAAIGGIDSSADDPEALSFHLLAEQVILGKENPFVKSVQAAKFLQIEEHEHPCREGTVEAGEILKQVIAGVEQPVDPVTVAA